MLASAYNTKQLLLLFLYMLLYSLSKFVFP